MSGTGPDPAVADFAGATIVLRRGGAFNVEIVDAEQAREHIARGELRRETMVTVYDGDSAELRQAGRVACLAPLFDGLLGADGDAPAPAPAPTDPPVEEAHAEIPRVDVPPAQVPPDQGQARPEPQQPAAASAPPSAVGLSATGDGAASLPESGPEPATPDATDLSEARARVAAAAAAALAAKPPVLQRPRPKRNIPAVDTGATDPSKAAETASDKKPGSRWGVPALFVAVILAFVIFGRGKPDNKPIENTTTTTEATQPAAGTSAPSPTEPSPAAPEAVAEVAPSPPTYPASFDCSRAAAADEQMICHDPTLAAADTTANRAYAAVMAQLAGPERAIVRASQRDWLRRRHDCANAMDAASCLASSYDERIAQLQRISQGIAADAAQAQNAPVIRDGGVTDNPLAGNITCALPGGEQVTLALDQCRQRNGVRIGG